MKLQSKPNLFQREEITKEPENLIPLTSSPIVTDIQQQQQKQYLTKQAINRFNQLDHKFKARVLRDCGQEVHDSIAEILSNPDGNHKSYAEVPSTRKKSVWCVFIYVDSNGVKWPIVIRFWMRRNKPAKKAIKGFGIPDEELTEEDKQKLNRKDPKRMTSVPGFQRGTKNIIVPEGCPRKELEQFVAKALGRESTTDYYITRYQLNFIFHNPNPGITIGGPNVDLHLHHTTQRNPLSPHQTFDYCAATDDRLSNLELLTSKEHEARHKEMGDNEFFSYKAYPTELHRRLQIDHEFEAYTHLQEQEFQSLEDYLLETADDGSDIPPDHIIELDEFYRRLQEEAEARYNFDPYPDPPDDDPPHYFEDPSYLAA